MAKSRDRYPNAQEHFKQALDRLDDLEDKMSTFDGEVKHLATRADLEKLRADTNAAEKRMYSIVLPAVALYLPFLIAIFEFFL